VNPAAKALWFIEAHFAQAPTLDEIATFAGVSRFHLSRIFGALAGCSVIRYARGRRLTEAARALANGAPDIFQVALDAGYNSHEAFTRAFREQFGITPEALRARGNLHQIQLLEAIKMDERLLESLEAPRFENHPTLLLAGLSGRYTPETVAGVPAQWQRFIPWIGHIPGQIGCTTYGVVCNADDAGSMEYLCGVEVTDFTGVPAELTRLRIPETAYAVFTHRDHISNIRRTWFTIYNKWFPESQWRIAEGPEFEKYGPEFNPQTGTGVLEIWIPVRPVQ
jgi:AraC family transcriptional regulator